jgi:arylsulfatase A-like enzyme
MRFLVRRDPTRPFFLYASFDKPHPPLTPPPEYFDIYRSTRFAPPARGSWLDDGVPRHIAADRLAHNWDLWGERDEEIQDTLRAYAALITHIDTRIGPIIGTLRELGLLQNTLILFVADHGDQLFDHGGFAKGDFLTGSCQIPFILTPPESDPSIDRSQLGRVVRHVSPGLIDVMPTLLDFASIPAPEGIEGQSLRPFFSTRKSEFFRPYSFGRCQDRFGLSDGRHRYTWLAADDREFLFDLDQDPLNETNLATDPAHREITAAWRARLVEQLTRLGDEHVRDGQLVPCPQPAGPETVHTQNRWNNPGWR